MRDLLHVSRFLGKHRCIWRLVRNPANCVGMLLAHRLRGDNAIAKACFEFATAFATAARSGRSPAACNSIGAEVMSALAESWRMVKADYQGYNTLGVIMGFRRKISRRESLGKNLASPKSAQQQTSVDRLAQPCYVGPAYEGNDRKWAGEPEHVLA